MNEIIILWSNRYTSLYHVTPTLLRCRGNHKSYR